MKTDPPAAAAPEGSRNPSSQWHYDNSPLRQTTQHCETPLTRRFIIFTPIGIRRKHLFQLQSYAITVLDKRPGRLHHIHTAQHSSPYQVPRIPRVHSATAQTVAVAHTGSRRRRENRQRHLSLVLLSRSMQLNRLTCFRVENKLLLIQICCLAYFTYLIYIDAKAFANDSPSPTSLKKCISYGKQVKIRLKKAIYLFSLRYLGSRVVDVDTSRPVLLSYLAYKLTMSKQPLLQTYQIISDI